MLESRKACFLVQKVFVVTLLDSVLGDSNQSPAGSGSNQIEPSQQEVLWKKLKVHPK